MKRGEVRVGTLTADQMQDISRKLAQVLCITANDLP
jgi:hypothetical protein